MKGTEKQLKRELKRKKQSENKEQNGNKYLLIDEMITLNANRLNACIKIWEF